MAHCVVCAGSFRRECITEHDDRLYCAPCFAHTVQSPNLPRSGRIAWRRQRSLALAVACVLCLIVGFYLLGRILVALPSKYHDGTIWKEEFD